jgi:hypothetical protein
MEPASETQVASPTKQCPFCAETILAEAKKCRFCGEFLDTPSSKVGFDPERMRRALSIVGSLLLLIAPFAPLMSGPIVGRITLFQQGKGDGVILLIAALVALGLSIFGRYGFLWVSGIIGLIDVLAMFRYFWFQLPTFLEDYRRQTVGNVFGSIGELTLRNMNPDWGVPFCCSVLF